MNREADIPASPPVRESARAVRSDVLYGSLALAFIAVGYVTLAQPEYVEFSPITVESVLEVLAPLALVSLFLERTLEVFLTPWRAHQAEEEKSALKAARDAAPGRGLADPDVASAHLSVQRYRAGTRKTALLVGLALGLLVAAFGMRLLEPLAQTDSLAELPASQLAVFRFIDFILTGAVLGGGADGIHKIMDAFTSVLEGPARRAEGDVAVEARRR